MGKHRSKKNKLAMPKLPITKEPPKRSFGWIATPAGLFLALIVFWPRPTIDLAQPSDPQNPYSASFTVTNNTPLVPLEDVTVGVGICQSVTEPIPFNYDYHCDTDRLTMISFTEWQHQYISADQKLGVSFENVIRVAPDAKLAGGDLAAIVTYHWWFMPYEFKKSFRFVTRKSANGTLQWFSRPVDSGA
jgi:hypothetical protein